MQFEEEARATWIPLNLAICERKLTYLTKSSLTQVINIMVYTEIT